jgi:hypothetical protein
MKNCPLPAVFAAAVSGLFALAPVSARADAALSAAKLDLLDDRGYFTPAFKAAVHDLVDARQAVAQDREDEAKAGEKLPGLKEQVAAAQLRVADLRRELALYQHPEDADFEALQAEMKDAAAQATEQLALAQAFVWSYPNDPRQAEAEQDLRQVQAKISAQQESVREAEAARQAAQARLVERAKARQLSLAEWQSFLLDKSQEELLGYLGRPQGEGDGYWIYSGTFIVNPVTNVRTGLLVNFNGTRVVGVAAAPPEP